MLRSHSRWTLNEKVPRLSAHLVGAESYIADSEEHWADASPKQNKCPYKHTKYELMLGLCIRENTWVRWISLGARCVRCGVLSSPADWKSDLDLADAAFVPKDHAQRAGL